MLHMDARSDSWVSSTFHWQLVIPDIFMHSFHAGR